jgi:hypothetical protein
MWDSDMEQGRAVRLCRDNNPESNDGHTWLIRLPNDFNRNANAIIAMLEMIASAPKILTSVSPNPIGAANRAMPIKTESTPAKINQPSPWMCRRS